MQNWLLPEKIADVLPSEARKIEELRRALLDHYRLYGYELVMPPLIEYEDSLLSGAGQEMDLRMFKFVDQISGRTLAVRADMTTQVARIDAHLLNRNSVTRLCYAGSVLQTYPIGLYTTREPFQIGCEIYGHAGLEADAEIHQLVVSSLALAGISQVHLDLCHIGVLRALLAEDTIAQQYEAQVFTLLAAKDMSAIAALADPFKPSTRAALLALPDLYGDAQVIQRARTILPALAGINAALNELVELIELLSPQLSSQSATLMIDLSDLRGYHYHSGVMFAVYTDRLPNAVARGGRYDQVGAGFGRARSATGFSMDLRELARIMPSAPRTCAIRAPWSKSSALQKKIMELRQAGEIVIQSLPGHENEQDEFDCDRLLTLTDSSLPLTAQTWVIQNLPKLK